MSCIHNHLSGQLMFRFYLNCSKMKVEILLAVYEACRFIILLQSVDTMCLYISVPLLHVLSMHSKILTTKPYTDLWSHITGVSCSEETNRYLYLPYNNALYSLFKFRYFFSYLSSYKMFSWCHRKFYIWYVNIKLVSLRG